MPILAKKKQDKRKRYGPARGALRSSSGLAGVRIETWLNGRCEHSAAVGEMRFGPADLLSFISQVMPLEPGDIVSTGTPGAVVLAPGDVAECRITGFQPLTNPVVRAATWPASRVLRRTCTTRPRAAHSSPAAVTGHRPALTSA